MRFLIINTLVIAAGFFAASHCRAGDQPGIEHFLPADVLFHVSVPEPAQWESRLSRTEFAQRLNDPEFAELKAELARHQLLFRDEFRNLLGVEAQTLLRLPGPVSFAVVPRQNSDPAWLFGLDFGTERSTVDRMLAASAPQWRKVSWKIVDSLLLVSPDAGLIDDVLARRRHSETESLGDHSCFQSIRLRTSEPNREPLLRWYARPVHLWRHWLNAGDADLSEAAPQRAMLLEALPERGQEVLQAMGGSIDLSTDRFDLIVRTATCLKPSQDSLMSLLDFPALPQAPPRWVPEQADWMTLHWNMVPALKALEDQKDAVNLGGSLHRIIVSVNRPFENSSGLNIQKDLLGNLTGDLHIVHVPTEEDSELELIIAARVRDTERMQQVLQAGMRLPLFLFPERLRHGKRLYEITSLPVPGQPKSSAGIGLVGSYLIWTSRFSRLEEIASGTEVPNLSQSKGFQAAAELQPEKTSMAGFQYSDALIDQCCRLLFSGPDRSGETPKQTALRRLAVRKLRQPMGFFVVPDEEGTVSVLYTLPKSGEHSDHAD